MDPLDREEPFSAPAKLVMIMAVVGVVYLMVRFAVVIPEWGWQLISTVTLVGAVLYYALAYRKPRAPLPPVQHREFSAGRLLHYVTAALLALVLTLPLWVALYFWRFGVPDWLRG